MAQVVECLHAYQAEGPKFTSTARKKKKKKLGLVEWLK
jgi:hypothetical protein